MQRAEEHAEKGQFSDQRRKGLHIHDSLQETGTQGSVTGV